MVTAAVASGTLVPATAGWSQQSPPETGTIRNGTAKATALVSRIGPGVGNLELAMRGGVSVTQVTNSLAQATSQTADLGLVGSSLTAGSCRGGEATFTAEDLPQPTSVDNRKGDATLSRDESRTDGSPFGFGRMEVSATKSPVASNATTTSSAFDIAPAVRVGSGRGQAATQVLPGEGRQAEAIVTSSLDLGGVVTMEGMRWRAFHRTGVDPLAEAGFEIGRATVGALPFPTNDLAEFEQAANTALATVGVSIAFPKVERFLDPNDLVRVTPMRITFRDSPLGKTLLAPVLDATREQRSELFEQMVAAACETAGALLVADVVVSIVAGTGFLTLELGGAEALSSDFGLVDPFGAYPPPPALDELPPALASDVPAVSVPTAVPGVATAAPVSSTTPAPPTEQGMVAARSGPLEEVCESVHPNRDACSDGAALALGFLALVAAIGVAGAEIVWQRRARTGVVS